MHITIKDLPSGYRKVLDFVIDQGSVQDSRVGMTTELVGAQVVIERPWLCGTLGIGRFPNVAIGELEALQLIAGEAYPELMSRATKRRFDDYRDGEVLHGSYGPRLRNQIPGVLALLCRDPDTRQAVLQVWDPAYDQQERRDIPCTLGFQLFVRDKRLEMVTTMRSNDVWLGFPYDIYQFAQLQCTMASCLGISPGRMTHNAGSLHLYENDREAASKVTARSADDGDVHNGVHAELFVVESVLDRWVLCRRQAQLALSGCEEEFNVSQHLLNNGRAIARRFA